MRGRFKLVGLLEFVVAQMNTEVLVQVGFLGKGLLAVSVHAFEGPLATMGAQVVKEIVPLAKDHLAAFVVALHDADVALRLLVLKAVHPKALKLRHKLIINVELLQVDVGPELHLHIRILNNLLHKCFFVVFALLHLLSLRLLAFG